MNRFVRALYRTATRLLPTEFRQSNEDDLESLYREALERAAGRGRWAWSVAVGRGLWDVLKEAVRMRVVRRRRASRPIPTRTNTLESTLQDLRLATRSLAKSPGFTLTAVAMLALGIGANTSLFSVVNAVLLRAPRHVERPDRLVSVYTSDYSGPAYGASSLPDFFDFRDQTSAFADASPLRPGAVSVPTDEGDSEQLVTEYVGGNYFQLLGVEMARGRAFSPQEADLASGAGVVVLSHGYWTRRFGADPEVIGRSIRVSGHPLTIVGVAPEGFGGVLPLVTPDLWMPLSTYALMDPSGVDERSSRSWMIVARLTDGAMPGAAQEQLTAMADRLRATYPRAWVDVSGATRRVTVVPDVGLPPQVKGVAFGFAALLLAVFLVTLLIACANLANLTLARATRRKRDVALKVALGASRSRIVRQLLAESTIVAFVGGVIGTSLGLMVIGAARNLPPIAGVELALDASADRRVLLFSALLTILTALAVGLIPALGVSRADPGRTLKGERGEGRGAFRWLTFRNILVMGQVAATLVLLVGAGLMLKSVRTALQIDPGFDVDDVATLSMSLGPEGYTAEQTLDLFRELTSRVARLPGVEAVSYTDALPMTPAARRRRGISIPGYEPGPAEDMEFQVEGVGPGLVDALGMELLRGRDVSASDDATAARVLLVNESFARRFWPGEDPIGKLVTVGGRGEAQVVGLLRDALYRDLGDEDRPAFFLPVSQSPGTSLTLVARTSPGRAPALLTSLRNEASQLDDRVPVAALQTMEDTVASVLLPQRIASWLLSIAGALGMLLGAAGLYGVMSFVVSQRTREIGLRIALGAKSRDVIARVVGRGVLLAAVGAAIGLAVAAGVTPLIASLLLQVSPLDAGVFSVMAVAALVVGGFASWMPAKRAATVDPMVALRLE